MVSIEVCEDYRRAERSRGIKRASCVKHAEEFGDKQSQSDTDWSDKCRLVLLCCEQQNGKHQTTALSANDPHGLIYRDLKRGQEHLDEKTLRDRNTSTELGSVRTLSVPGVMA